MQYHLVLQFPIKGDDEADQLATLEDDFIELLQDSADVDGHETDGSLLNLFISTPEPDDTFDRIRPLLEDRRLLQTAIVAYRHVDEEEYTVVWPEGESERHFKSPA